MDRPVVLIAGGQGKGADFTALRDAVGRHCRALVLIGADAPALRAALEASADTFVCDSLDAAVQRAAQLAQPGDTVLLSPACASFDMFPGFVARGEAFVAAVRALEEAV